MKTTIERHRLEGVSLTATAVVAALCWLLVIGEGGLMAALLLVAGAWVSQEMMFATALLRSVRAGPEQLPELWSRYAQVGARLGVTELHPLYVQQSGGMVNAYAARIARRSQVVLMSGLLDALENDPEALDFIVAHELGHHLARHTSTTRLLLISPLSMVGLVPFQLGLSRGQEFTADRHGLHGSSLAAGERALMVLLGGRIAARANTTAVLAQWHRPGPWGHLVELVSTHPNPARRILELREYAHRFDHRRAEVPLATTCVDAG